MTTPENEFVRRLASDQRTSLNDAITGLIRDRMAASPYENPEPPAPPAGPRPPADPAAPKKRRPLHDRRKGSVNLTWSDAPEPIPGQTAITDPDQ